MVVGFIVGLGVVGALLVVGGMRGRRIDDHPGCRRCGFDLFGSMAGSVRCPECGANLELKRAVRHGRRRRRPVVLGGGVLLILLTATWFVLLITGVLARYNFNPYKPTWWLAIEAGSTDATTLPPVLNELRARLERGELSEERIESLAATGLDRVDALGKAWPGEWDQFILRAWRLHHLSDAIKLRFTPVLAEQDVFLQPASMNGEPAAMPCASLHLRRRVGDGWYRVKLVGLKVDGEERTVEDVPYDELPGLSVVNRGAPRPLGEPILLPSEGPHQIEMTVEWRLAAGYGKYDEKNQQSTGIGWQSKHLFTQPDSESDRPILELLTNEETRLALMESISVHLYGIRGEGDGPRRGAGVLSFRDVPVDVQAMMTLRAGDREISRGGDVMAQASRSSFGGGGSSKTFTIRLPAESITSMTLVLEPHWFMLPSADRRPAGPNRVWYDTLEIPDLPVEWFDDLEAEQLPKGIRDIISRTK